MTQESAQTPHALAPDLEAIRAIAARPVHVMTEERHTALAIYEDVCWRLALGRFPGHVWQEIRRLEGDAVALLRLYVSGALEGERFWAAFLAVAQALDDLTGDWASVQAQDELEARQALMALESRVVKAALPPIVRAHVQGLLDAMNDALDAFHAGRAAGADFWPAYENARSEIESTLAAATEAVAPASESRLHQLAQAALTADLPIFLRDAVAARLVSLAASWQAGRPLSEVALQELESLLGRGTAFQRTHQAAETRFRALSEACGRHPLPAPFQEDAEDQLAAMTDLMRALDAGRLAPEAFRVRFEVAAHHLDQVLALVGQARPGLAEAEARLAEARSRVAEANLPRFVSHTAHDLLAYLASELGDYRASGGDADRFAAAIQGGLTDLGVCLAFGEEVLNEERSALRRFQRLEHRVADTALNPMLRGPAADLLETLRELLDRLNKGLFPLVEFHRAFDEVADRVEKLLGWQRALDGASAMPPSLVSGHHPEP
jgi:hypothetical protein